MVSSILDKAATTDQKSDKDKLNRRYIVTTLLRESRRRLAVAEEAANSHKDEYKSRAAQDTGDEDLATTDLYRGDCMEMWKNTSRAVLDLKEYLKHLRDIAGFDVSDRTVRAGTIMVVDFDGARELVIILPASLESLPKVQLQDVLSKRLGLPVILASLDCKFIARGYLGKRLVLSGENERSNDGTVEVQNIL